MRSSEVTHRTRGTVGRDRGAAARTVRASVVAAVVAAGAAALASAQPGPMAFDAETRAAVVRELAKALRDRYVFPDVGARAAAAIEKQAAAGAYASLGPGNFGDALTRDLREVAHDKHLGVYPMPPRPVGAPPTADEDRAQQARRMARDNFGVQKLEVLPGNVGYLDLRSFPPAELGGETAIAAMNVLGNTDAVIVDVRHNGGGEPSQIALITSYFFDKPTHLNDLHWRAGDRTVQFWTTGYVPGKRLSAVPVYVLTSQGTFSAGEEFANNLKVLKRATIVGETTGGGANPGEGVDLPGNMAAFIPSGRAVNPVTKTNWEGVGVEPDVKVKADDALKTAYAAALEQVAAAAKDTEQKARAEWYLEQARAEAQPVTLGADALQPLTGRFGPRVVTLEGGALFYEREGRPKRRLTPLSKDTFAVEEVPEFRVRFVTDASGRASKLVGLYEDGETDEDVRTP